MFKITESTAYHKTVVADNFDSADAAKSYLGGNSGKIVFCEEDADYPGFYDLFMKDGRILAIEPMDNPAPQFVDISEVTEYGLTQRLSAAVRVF